MDGELLFRGLFYFLAVVALGSAGVVAFSRNIGRAIFMLLFTLGAVAGFYAWLGAGYLSLVQVLIYVGGILVILLFALMVSEQFPIDPDASDPDKLLGSGGVALVFLAGVFSVYLNLGDLSPIGPESYPSPTELGEQLLSTYLLPFELAGVILLVALMAATLLTRNPDRNQGETSS